MPHRLLSDMPTIFGNMRNVIVKLPDAAYFMSEYCDAENNNLFILVTAGAEYLRCDCCWAVAIN